MVAGLAGASVVQTIMDGGLGLALASAVARGDRSSHEITGAKVTLCVAIGVRALCGSLTLPAQLAVPAAAVTSGAASALIPVSALVAGHRFAYGASALVGPNILFLLLVLCLPSMGAADLLLVFAATNTVCAAVGLSAKEVRLSRDGRGCGAEVSQALCEWALHGRHNTVWPHGHCYARPAWGDSRRWRLWNLL